MKLVAFLAAVIIARPLFPAASGYTTAIDNAGNVWRTGEANTVMTTATAFQKTAVPSVCGTENLSTLPGPTPLYCKHAYLVEQDGSENVLCATYLGGSSQDGATAVATDPQGNIYVAGYSYSPDFPVTAGAVQAWNAGPLTPPVITQSEFPYGPSTLPPGATLSLPNSRRLCS